MVRTGLWRDLCLPQAHLGPPSLHSSLGWVLRLVLAKNGGGGRIVYFDNIRAFSPTSSCYFESPGEQGLWLN